MIQPDSLERLARWLGSGSINLFGRPFAGKDTQGQRLAETFNGVLLGGGDILRGSHMPYHIKEHMRRGTLIPTEDYMQIVLPFLRSDRFNGKPLILSSVGRWHGEERGVIEAAEASGHSLKAVIHLSLDDRTVHDRWHSLKDRNDRGDRHDDTLEILDIRLQEYRDKTLPVLDTYEEIGLLRTIDGTKSVDEVTSAIMSALDDLANPA